LTLLLIRRRVLRLEEGSGVVCQEELSPTPDTRHPTADTMCVYCPKRDATYEVPIDMPSGPRIDEIQKQLSDLLVAGAD
jgi:hypothetical protein